MVPATYEFTTLDANESNLLPYLASAAKVLRSIGPWSLSYT